MTELPQGSGFGARGSVPGFFAFALVLSVPARGANGRTAVRHTHDLRFVTEKSGRPVGIDGVGFRGEGRRQVREARSDWRPSRAWRSSCRTVALKFSGALRFYEALLTTAIYDHGHHTG
jgi:hypothetical protein